ncbi:MAG: glycoside hydrolase family protein [Planctomycetota bacterium]
MHDLNLRSLLPDKLDKQGILDEEHHNVWGTNVLKGRDGKYHAIYSRWPKSRGHMAWVTHSEIAHAVADHLTGPYLFQNLVLPPRGNDYWDGDCTHNPHVLEHDGKYYLYHMGNRGSGYWDSTPETRMPAFDEDEWWVNRNNQRVGLAIADDLNGPWRRSDAPLIDVQPGRLITSTPTATRRPDGKFLLAYKYVEDNGQPRGGRVIHVTALGESPTGPFRDTGVPFITHPTAPFAIDDHVEFVVDRRYYCIAKDCYQSWGDYPAGTTVLFESDANGLEWHPSKHFVVLEAGALHWTDGTTTLCERTADMPKVYTDDGVPKALIIAVLPRDSEVSFAVIIPLQTRATLG